MKKIFDKTISLTLLSLLSPILLVIIIITMISMGKPVFFIQPRIGKNNRIFYLYKFRSMSNKDKYIDIKDEDRVTPFGHFLRNTSLDELPGLINIIKGEMSLVGPRPLLVEYLPYYSDYHLKRHEVLPGITGWAQINGRNLISWEEKFDLDIWYVENNSFLIDIKILIKTFVKVLLREGVSPKNKIIMTRFDKSSTKRR